MSVSAPFHAAEALEGSSSFRRCRPASAKPRAIPSGKANSQSPIGIKPSTAQLGALVNAQFSGTRPRPLRPYAVPRMRPSHASTAPPVRALVHREANATAVPPLSGDRAGSFERRAKPLALHRIPDGAFRKALRSLGDEFLRPGRVAAHRQRQRRTPQTSPRSGNCPTARRRARSASSKPAATSRSS